MQKNSSLMHIGGAIVLSLFLVGVSVEREGFLLAGAAEMSEKGQKSQDKVKGKMEGQGQLRCPPEAPCQPLSPSDDSTAIDGTRCTNPGGKVCAAPGAPCNQGTGTCTTFQLGNGKCTCACNPTP
jgi:hypothetical protein